MRDDGPGPWPVEIQMSGSEFGAILFERVDGPHGHVGNQQEGDQLAAGLVPSLLRRAATPPPGVDYEQGLKYGLIER